MRTPFTDLLDLDHPVVQAPMAGVSTPAMAAAVSGAGGLGSIAVGAMQAAAADQALADALAATVGPINVNVFTHPSPARDPAREQAWLRTLAPAFQRLGLAPPREIQELYRPFDDSPDLMDVLMSRRPPVVSFHFGLPDPARIRSLKSYGACLMATATSVAEARRIVAAGIDVVVAQGFEAGGHRGAFDPARDEALSTLALLPRIVQSVDVPVLAAGGITSGTGIAAALTLGAAGVQLGSAFIDCPESAASDAHRLALHDPNARTVMTAAFSGRPARGLVNRFVREFGRSADQAPGYPLAYDPAKRLAAAAEASGSCEYTAMWAGQGAVRPEALPAKLLVQTLARELEAAAGRAASTVAQPCA